MGTRCNLPAPGTGPVVRSARARASAARRTPWSSTCVHTASAPLKNCANTPRRTADERRKQKRGGGLEEATPHGIGHAETANCVNLDNSINARITDSVHGDTDMPYSLDRTSPTPHSLEHTATLAASTAQSPNRPRQHREPAHPHT